MKRGQAMLEYMVVLAGMLGVVAVMFILVRAAIQAGERTENIVASDYP